MYYINVSRQQIEELRPAIDLLVQLWGEDLDKGALFLYGMVDESSPIIAAMGASVDGGQVSYGAVAIPMNSDSLYFVTGSGYALKQEPFAYISNGEIRTSRFNSSTDDNVVAVGSFTKLAISSSDAWLDRFIKLEAPQAMTPEHGDKAERSESGTNVEHGGLVHEETELPEEKRSSVEDTTPVVDVWATTNIEEWSVEELYKLLHDLKNEGVDNDTSTFFLWNASDASGYLIQVEGSNEAAAKLIATELGINSEEVLEEGVSLTGRELASSIEALLGGA